MKRLLACLVLFGFGCGLILGANAISVVFGPYGSFEYDLEILGLFMCVMGAYFKPPDIKGPEPDD